MRKILFLLGLVTLIVVAVVGCSASTSELPTEEAVSETGAGEATSVEKSESESVELNEIVYEDGYYFAKESTYNENSGWKSTVILKVEGGRIVLADWNGVSIKAGMTKDEASKAGFYPMVENAGAQAPWHEQAMKIENNLLETQDPKMITYIDDEGHVDVVTGVSISVSDFYELAQIALADGPKEMGPYTDGSYFAEEDDFSKNSGWKETVSITVIFGNIESVNWNGIHKDGGNDKKTASIKGEYPIVENGGAQAPWHVQAEKAEAYLIKTQDPLDVALNNDDDHSADVISGVTIGVGPMYKLAEKALSSAK